MKIVSVFLRTVLGAECVVASSDVSAAIGQAKRDQPWLNALFYWDNRIVAHAGGLFFAVNPSEGTAVPICFVGNRSLVSLTTALGRPYALGKDDRSYVLLSKAGKGHWEMTFVPSGKNGEAERYFAAIGTDNYLVILGTTSFALFDGSVWISRAYSKEFHPDYGDTYCMRGSTVYAGRDQGEFGGGLLELDLPTGKWFEVKAFSSAPVTDIIVGPDRALWVVCGLAHMGGIYGRLSRLTEDGVQDELTLNNFGAQVANNDWRYGHASIAALCFNDRGARNCCKKSGLIQK